MRSLFPQWRISVERQAIWLFVLVMSMLILPKLLSLLVHLREPKRRAQFGGSFKLILSVVLETLASTLLAPNLAYLQTRFLVGILMGKSVKWETQQREDHGTSFREALRRHWLGTLLGLLWSGLLLSTVPKLFWWFSPFCLGLVLAIPLSIWTSRTRPGDWARKRRLFLIPEELESPHILQRLHHELALAPGQSWARVRDGLARVLEDSHACAAHLSLLPRPSQPIDPLHEHHLRGLELKVHYHGLQALTRKEKRELLLDPDSIHRLKTNAHRQLDAAQTQIHRAA